ncbi:MAG: hypothetical protein ACYCSD_08945 [Acidiferrobacteraceae bacterium]
MSRSVSIFLVGAFFMLALREATAAEWSMTPSLSFRQTYYSNVLFTPFPHRGAWGERVSPWVRFSGKTEVFSVTGTARLNFRRYWGMPGLNTTDKILKLGSHYTPDERDRFGLGVNSIQDSTLLNEFSANTIVEPRRPRNLLTYNPSWTRYLSETTSLRMDYNRTRVNYQHAAGTYLIDYADQTGTMTLQHTVSEHNTLIAQVFFDKFNTVPDNYRARTYGFTGGIDYRISESVRANANLGVSDVRSTLSSQALVCLAPLFFGACPPGAEIPVNTASQFNAKLITAQARVTKRWETSDVSLNLSRRVMPSGIGSLIRENSLGLSMSDRFSEKVTGSMTASVTESQYLSSVIPFSTSRYYTIAPGLAWRLTRRWTLASGVAFANDSYTGSSQSVSATAVYLTLRYSGLKMTASR